MIVALVALFVALGGTAFAVAQLNGRQIVVRSIPGNRLKRNAVTGREIKEGSLGIVPSAKISKRTKQLLVTRSRGAHGRSGARAADSSPGTIVTLASGEGATLLSQGPFTVSAHCSTTPQGAPSREIDISVSSSEAGSDILVPGQQFVKPDPGQPVQVFAVGADQEAWESSAGFAALAPSGESLNVGRIVAGVNVLGSDCAVLMYAIG